MEEEEGSRMKGGAGEGEGKGVGGGGAGRRGGEVKGGIRRRRGEE